LARPESGHRQGADGIEFIRSYAFPKLRVASRTLV